MRELIIDNFAGGGGASTGIEQAVGRPIDVAINHDPEAIAMHMVNHPNTKHYCEDIWQVDPLEATQGKPVGLCWLSPNCTHFSKAKGAALLDRGIRGLAWVALKWAVKVRPRIIMLENVEEFKTWCRLDKDGRPVKGKEGEWFELFVNSLRAQGYVVEWRELKAFEYGAPTTRKRLFMIARCDGQPIVWPEPTHGKPEDPLVWLGFKAPWRTAAEIIDWSLPCPSIFERKKPLADNTLRRIARGIVKYVIEAKEPFIVCCNHGGDGFRGQSINEPFKTVTAAHDAHGLVVPTLIQTGYGERPGQVPRVPGLNKPLGTVMGQGQKHALIGASLIQCGFGEAPNSPPRCIDPNKPLGTVMAGTIKHGLAVAHLIKQYGGNGAGAGIDLNEPIHTVTATDHHSLVSANLIRHFGESTGSGMDEPTRTVMADGGGKTGLVSSHLVKLYGTSTGSQTHQPLPTVTATGNHIGEVRAFLMKYYGTGTGQELKEPLHTITAKDRLALVRIDAEDYVIGDIGMRMLEPHELYAAQGFPKDYSIAPEINGKRLSKKAQVRMAGNSVCPDLARVLVMANYRDEENLEQVV